MEKTQMRKLVVLTFLSLDGVMQAPGGPDEDSSSGFKYGGWTVPYFDEFLGGIMGEQMSKRADLLLGRKTFEIFAGYWPQHEDDWPGINDITKYVASDTLARAEWNNTVFLKRDALVGELKKLKQGDGPDIQVHGSADLIQTLLKHDLIDEFWLKIFPVTLGSGKRLFGEGVMPAAFTADESQLSPGGVLVVNYRRAGDLQTGSF